MIMADLLRSDGTRPRVTYYDEAPGPTQGERIELSAIALDNWVAKAANLLVEEYDAAPGTVITLRLPDGHWRTLYWALGVFATGATLDLTGAADSALTITDDPATAADPLIVVTLPALARRHPGPLPAGALDEAAEISGYPDVPIAPATPVAGDRALITADGEFDYAGWSRRVRPAPGCWSTRPDRTSSAAASPSGPATARCSWSTAPTRPP